VVVLTDPPGFAKRSRKATAQQGYAFENKVGRKLRRLADGLGWQLWEQQWLWEKDKYHCPDFVLIAPSGCAIIVEAKLTLCETDNQRFKYEGLLTQLGHPAISVTVCKNLTPAVDQDYLVTELEDIFPDAVVHLWL